MNISTWIIICSLIAAGLAGIIATLQFIKQKRDDTATISFQQKLIEKQDKIEQLQQNAKQQTDNIIAKQNELIQLQSEINQKNEVIQALQKSTIQAVKGTDKPPSFRLASNLYKIVFAVTNESSDLNASFGVSIYDFEALKKCKIREGNIVDENCAHESLFFSGDNIRLKPKQTSSISPKAPIPIIIGTKYKYLIYIDINDESYLEQVYINASSQSIDTQIRILKFDGGDYRYYSEPYKNGEKINWDKEFNLPKVLSVGKVVN